MKRILSLTIIMVCCTLTVAAQESGLRVNYQGAKPTIRDFVKSFLTSIVDSDGEDGWEGEAVYMYKDMQQAMENQTKGIPTRKDETLTIDLKNGYLLFEQKLNRQVSRIETCYWNESDGKHKLFAVNRWTYVNGKPIMGQYDALMFYRYDNATRTMEECDAPGFEVEFDNTAYALPRTGKDIIVTKWNDNDSKTNKTLKWNGHGFSY